MEKLSEKKRFSILARKRSFTYAFRGLRILFETQQNSWIQMVFAFLIIFLGVTLKISLVEWTMIIFSIGFVLTAEAFNTAIEIDIDLTSPTYHPYARDTKDVAAGAVLLASFTAIAVGMIVFIPKLLLLFGK
ncbi:MAG TPA: diacylglycerol kinase family protein [Cyclobacteriaceae bacterium]|jgi:diacylglycerol kinase|nr:diacylglycerol kinase family protein [Cyclobacteriaceae bacterium]